MKRQFMAFMDANPVPQRRTSALSPYFPHLMRVPAFMAAFLILMGGTAYAAENSLPNDFLYPIKTEVLEPLFIETPARTPIAKAQASQELVERRLEEAEALIDQDELDADSAAGIAAAVDEHASDIQAYVAGATLSGELSDALGVGTDLENVLEAHGEVLETIAEDSTATEAVSDLIEAIADQADEIEAASDTLEDQTSQTQTEERDEYIDDARAEAQEATDSLRASLTEFPDLNEELVAEATSLLESSQSAYETGNSYLTEGQDSAALPQLRDAQQLAQQGLILIKSHEELTEGDADSNP